MDQITYTVFRHPIDKIVRIYSQFTGADLEQLLCTSGIKNNKAKLAFDDSWIEFVVRSDHSVEEVVQDAIDRIRSNRTFSAFVNTLDL